MRNNTDNPLRGSDVALGSMSIYSLTGAKDLVPRFPACHKPSIIFVFFLFYHLTRPLIRALDAVNRQPPGNEALPSDSHPSGQISDCIANMYGIATAFR